MDEKRKDLCHYRLEKAETCLSSARILVQLNDYCGAANRSYEYSKILTEAFQIRNDSDYDDYYILSKEDVDVQIQNAQIFFNGIVSYVNRTL